MRQDSLWYDGLFYCINFWFSILWLYCNQLSVHLDIWRCFFPNLLLAATAVITKHDLGQFGMWLITVHALAVLAYANWANKVLSAPRCYESVVKSKALPSKCIHYSWSVICLQRACSKRQYSNRFSYSSVKDISTTAQNASLSDTVSFLKKESQLTGSLVSLEGIRFLFSCSQTIKAQRAPCQGCSHQAPLRQARHTWPPGHSQSPRGLRTWWGFAHPSALWGTHSHPLLGAVPHALAPCSFPYFSL